MQKQLLQSIETGKYFTQPVFLDEKYILLSPETPLKESLKTRLLTWGYSYLFSDGESVNAPPTAAAASASAGDDAPLISYEEGRKDGENLKRAQGVFNDLLNFTEKVFTNFVSKNELPQREISERMRLLGDQVREQRRYLLRFKALKNESKNYIVEHSVKTAILSAAVGITFKLPPHKLIELGTTGLLHEIGMVKLPPQIYMSDKPLDPQQRKAITAHTVLGFKVLKEYSFPMPVCLGVLECRERLDGSGYPRGLTDEKLSLYGRIVGVTSAFAALVSNRPYRAPKEAHASLLELLQGRKVLYDERVLRALVANLSLYPIGSYVELANGYRGVVVETNDKDPRAPFVRLLASEKGEPLAEQPTVQTSESTYRVTRALSEDEIASLPSS
jgi:HD-GYP domain-containing protein (c-di-GMP phosphodiesterase class II)